ncbi:MAG: YceI family protein [Streptosporangiaceae bacterium]
MTGTFTLGPGAGRVLIKTTRIGFAARAGHDLTLEVTRWSAQVEVPPEDGKDGEDAGGVTAATVRAELDLGSIEVREGRGGAKPLSDRDRREIRKTMTGLLGTGTATFTSSRVVRSAASGGAGGDAVGDAVEGTLSLNGTSAPVRLQVTEPGPGRYRGSGTVQQTALGIKPYVGFFGALKVADEVTVEFEADLTQA